MKYKQPHPEFEVGSLGPFRTTITIAPQVSPLMSVFTNKPLRAEYGTRSILSGVLQIWI